MGNPSSAGHRSFSLATKLGVAVVSVSLTLSAAAAWLLDRAGARAVDRSTTEHMDLLASALEGSFQLFDAEKQAHPIADIVAEMGKHPAVDDLQVFGSSWVIRHSLLRSERGTTLPQTARRSGTTSEEGDLILVRHFALRASCVACHPGDSSPGGVRVVVNRRRVQASLLDFRVKTGVTGAGIIAGVLALVVLLTLRLVIMPIRTLLRTMGSAEDGDFLVRAPVHADDELGALARAFNKMLAAITDMRAQELERRQELVEAEAVRRLAPQLEEKQRIIEDQNAQLQARVGELQLLQDLARDLSATLDLEAQVEAVRKILVERLAATEFTLMVLDRPAGVLRVAGAAGFPPQMHLEDMTFEVGEGIAGLVVQTGQTLVVRDTANDERYLKDKARFTPQGSLVSLPLTHGGAPLGVLNVFRPGVDAFTPGDVGLLEAVVKQVSLAVSNAELYSVSVAQSLTDALTSLPNRRALDLRTELELARADRYGHALGVLMVDVDHFKALNDALGHQVGDGVLQVVAQVLAQTVRKTDVVSRYGGEEFCILLPGQDLAAAREVAEKLLRAVRSRVTRGPDPGARPLTISAGVAVYPKDGKDGTGLLAAADGALYAAKHAGRDCVRTTEEAPAQA